VISICDLLGYLTDLGFIQLSCDIIEVTPAATNKHSRGKSVLFLNNKSQIWIFSPDKPTRRD